MRKKTRGVNSSSKNAIRSMKIMISSLVSKVNLSQQVLTSLPVATVLSLIRSATK